MSVCFICCKCDGSVRLLEAGGFRDISKFKTLRAGDRVYRGYEDRTVMAAVTVFPDLVIDMLLSSNFSPLFGSMPV